jgi:hypothetical protein
MRDKKQIKEIKNVFLFVPNLIGNKFNSTSSKFELNLIKINILDYCRLLFLVIAWIFIEDPQIFLFFYIIQALLDCECIFFKTFLLIF